MTEDFCFYFGGYFLHVFLARLLLSHQEGIYVTSSSLPFCLVGSWNSLGIGAAQMPESPDAWEARLEIC